MQKALSKDDLLAILLGWLITDIKPSEMPELVRIRLISGLLTLMLERTSQR